MTSASGSPIRFKPVNGSLLLCCDVCGPASNIAAASVRTRAARRWLDLHRHPALAALAVPSPPEAEEYVPAPPGWLESMRAEWEASRAGRARMDQLWDDDAKLAHGGAR
ncbi:MAG: hypothetical protein LBE08_02230 [Bifidobacteriaceae bacterium]|jgi:hypothetical protein|nr:hypothetical protein [Bifidobacteriaceae bacterium]